MTILIKLTLGNIFIKVKKIRQGGTTVTKQLIYFSNLNSVDNFASLKNPWGPWGRQSSGMKPESADSVTVILSP